MEYFGANPEGEWCSLSGMYNSEEADFMAQFLGNSSFQNQADGFGSIQSTLWHEQSTTSALFPVSGDENYYFSESHVSLEANNGSISMEFCVGDVGNSSSYLIVGEDCLSKEMSNCNVEEPAATEEKCNILPMNSRKRSSDVQKNKRNVKAKKGHKVVSTNNDDEDGNVGLNGQSSSSCSEEDSNGSQESNGGVTSSLASKGSPILNSNGKIRASRGSATDPQSLYARKRRERINERLRILQNLVPNGTKVDISTMLEEAVQYVKFLQLQIKLLSSDDLWMYSPIAYNGMDIGLDIKIPTSRAS